MIHPAGVIKAKDFVSILPMVDTTEVLECTGAQVRSQDSLSCVRNAFRRRAFAGQTCARQSMVPCYERYQMYTGHHGA